MRVAHIIVLPILAVALSACGGDNSSSNGKDGQSDAQAAVPSVSVTPAKEINTDQEPGAVAKDALEAWISGNPADISTIISPDSEAMKDWDETDAAVQRTKYTSVFEGCSIGESTEPTKDLSKYPGEYYWFELNCGKDKPGTAMVSLDEENRILAIGGNPDSREKQQSQTTNDESDEKK